MLARILPRCGAARLALLVILLLTLPSPVQAAPALQGQQPDEGLTAIVTMFRKLGSLFIQAAYSLMFIVFAVGSVKHGLAAQVAQQFGATPRVSAELLNLAGGVVIFAFGLLTLPLVNWVVNQISSLYPTVIEISVPDFTIPQ